MTVIYLGLGWGEWGGGGGGGSGGGGDGDSLCSTQQTFCTVLSETLGGKAVFVEKQGFCC